MAWIRSMGASVLVALCLATAAEAAPVFIPMDAASDLEAEGFEYDPGGGNASYSMGEMTIDTMGFCEWRLPYGTSSKWWNFVDPSKGWWVEARLRVEVAEPDCASVGPGLWIHDRGHLFQLKFGPDLINVFPTGDTVAVDTSEYHVYRFESYIDGSRRVLVDDMEVLDLSGVDGGIGTLALNLGDLGGCGQSIVHWDHFSYDTFEPGSEDADADADGIPNAEDNCFEVNNPDQANMDGDGLGDVCDPCPLDELDDSDGDGVCDSDDACPNDPTSSEEPCPVGDSGFMGDGFGDAVGDDVGSNSGGSASTGSTSAGAEGGDGGCGCRSGSDPEPAAWWAVVALWVRRRRAYSARKKVSSAERSASLSASP